MTLTLPGWDVSLTLLHPERAWPLGAATAVLLLLGFLLRRRRRGVLGGVTAVLLRSVCLLVVAFLLLGPVRRVTETGPGALLVALDLSRSVAPTGRAEAWAGLAPWRRGEKEADLVVVGFGERPRLLWPGEARPAAIGAPGDLVSEPSDALSALLLSAAAGGDAARLMLLTDGAVPLPEGGLAGAPGLAPVVVALGGGGEPSVRVGALRVPEPPAPGEPLRLLLEGTATAPASAEVVVHVDGREARRIPVALGAGPFQVTLPLPAPSPGQHVIGARLLLPGDDPLDNGAATLVSVSAPPRVTVVSRSERPLVAAALKIQELGVDVVSPDAFLSAPGPHLGAGVIVLDRVDAAALSASAVLEPLRRAVERGAGLLYLPREEPGEMFDAAAKPFLELLPLAGRKPPPPPEPEKRPPAPPEAGEGLKPPDPEKRRREKVLAPSLGLLLVVDCSSSMKERGKIRLAIEAAIAAAEVVHDEDYLGIIQFNQKPRVLLELTKAGDRQRIIDRISRIEPRGGTSFGPALELAGEVFDGENLGVRHVILLSDGYSRPYRLKPLVTDMAKRGITVSTVGCGRDFDEQLLSDIAHWGKGKFQPAFDARSIPQIFTVEAERIIKVTGARQRTASREEPEKPSSPDPTPPPPAAEETEAPVAVPFRAGLPTPYLGGVRPHDVPGLLGFHPTAPRAGAWVSLETTQTQEPVCAHGHLGDGRVVAFTLPLEGGWATHLMGWEDYQVLLAQMVRFLYPDVGRGRFHVEAEGRGRTLRVKVLDREARALAESLVLEVEDEAGRRPKVEIALVRDGVWRVRLRPDEPSAGLVVRVGGVEDAGPRNVAGFARVAPPPEIRDRGLDLAGLQAWASALGGEVSPRFPTRVDVPPQRRRRDEPWGQQILPWLLLLLGVDFLLRRLFPGTG